MSIASFVFPPDRSSPVSFLHTLPCISLFLSKAIIMSTNNYKQIATDLLMLASKGNPGEAFSKHVCKNFKHHNIYHKGDGSR